MPRNELDNWFSQEVLAHDGLLLQFLAQNCQRDDIADVRQEVYSRIYESALKEKPKTVKAFMLTIARNVLINRARKAKIINFISLAEIEDTNVLLSRYDTEASIYQQREVSLLNAAIDSLPTVCRNILVLRKIKGKSQKQTAHIMGISESSVETHMSRGIRKVTEYLYGQPNDDTEIKAAKLPNRKKGK